MSKQTMQDSNVQQEVPRFLIQVRDLQSGKSASFTLHAESDGGRVAGCIRVARFERGDLRK
jgi:hypothetical protein